MWPLAPLTLLVEAVNSSIVGRGIVGRGIVGRGLAPFLDFPSSLRVGFCLFVCLEFWAGF